MPEQDVCMVCTVIIERRYIERNEHGVIFIPDNPLSIGHLIVAPLIHISSAFANPVITAQVARLATLKPRGDCTIVIPIGTMAGQVQPHMYMHIVPAEVGEARFMKNGKVIK